MVELVRLEQRVNEDFSDYVVCFRIDAPKCMELIEEKNLVRVYVNGAEVNYKPYLTTRRCQSFVALCMFAQDIGGVILTSQGDEAILTWKGKRKSSMAAIDTPSKLREERRKKIRDQSMQIHRFHD